MSEHDEQCAVVKWFKLQYPAHRRRIIAIPNGAVLSGNKLQRAKQMNYLKAEGLKVGTSDLFVAVTTDKYSGLWLEMKDRKKTKCTVSKDQQTHMVDMIEAGYAAAWAAGFDKAKEVIEEYMQDENN